MKRTTESRYLFLMLLAVAFAAHGQAGRVLASNVIVPQTRVVPMERTEAVQITEVKADVKIVDQLATTILEIHLHNPSPRRRYRRPPSVPWFRTWLWVSPAESRRTVRRIPGSCSSTGERDRVRRTCASQAFSDRPSAAAFEATSASRSRA